MVDSTRNFDSRKGIANDPLDPAQVKSRALTKRGGVLLDVVPLFVLFLVCQWWIMSVGHLPESSYVRPLIALELFRNLGLLQFTLLALGAALLIWKKALAWRYKDIVHGERWRPWLLLIVSMLAWTYVTYDYNLYYNQGHDWDRILLLVLAVAAVWRPVLLLPFVLLVTALATQFNYPIGGYSVAEQFVLVRILILFFAALLLQSVTAWPVSKGFVFLLLTLVASSYWWPGLGKLRLLWFTHGHVHLILPAAYSSGWLAFWNPESITSIVQFLATLNPFMVAFTLVAECGAIFFLWRRSFALLLLMIWIAFHLGVVALSGIFFWKWIMLNLGLLWLLWRSSPGQLSPVFGRKYFLLSVVLIGASHFWYGPMNLSWYDTPANYAYRLEATGKSGKTYQLAPRFFAPYEYQFSLSGFGYLVSEPRLGIVYGAIWERDVADELLAVETASDFFQLERERGRVRLDTRRAARFEQFIQRSVGNLNVRGTKQAWFTLLPAPSQLLSFPYNVEFPSQDQIIRVNVHQVTSLFNGEQYLEIRDEIVREIEVPPRIAPYPEANR
jgi:hypothetical protein